ncbi:MAG: DUF4293 family protein [Bacteroidia bacterium]|nr:DUF4293 family protein [Bacteroidia bacterium]
MIQRIQTVYLFIALILGTLMCFFPVAHVAESTIGFGSFIPYSVLCIFIPLILLVTIFIYKKRILQIRLTIFNIILMLFQLLLIVIYIYFLYKDNGANASIKISWPIVILPINIILSYLAIREIGKDEALVHSMERLR